MRIAITFVGIRVKLEVFNAKKVIIDREATGESLNFFISSIAFNPIGVAALPNPNKFAVKFDKIYPIAGCPFGISGNNLRMNGLKIFANTFKIPAFSATFMIPNQKTKILIKLMDNATASFAL